MTRRAARWSSGCASSSRVSARPPTCPTRGSRRAGGPSTRRSGWPKLGVANVRPEPAPAAILTPSGEGAFTVDLGRTAQRLCAFLGLAQAAPITLPLTVKRQGGRIAIDLPDLPDEAWTHLRKLMASIAGATPS